MDSNVFIWKWTRICVRMTYTYVAILSQVIDRTYYTACVCSLCSQSSWHTWIELYVIRPPIHLSTPKNNTHPSIRSNPQLVRNYYQSFCANKMREETYMSHKRKETSKKIFLVHFYWFIFCIFFSSFSVSYYSLRIWHIFRSILTWCTKIEIEILGISFYVCFVSSFFSLRFNYFVSTTQLNDPLLLLLFLFSCVFLLTNYNRRVCVCIM